MKVLFMTVGTGRDRSDIAAAILFGIRRVRPDRVVFFCSEKTAHETLPLIQEELGGTDHAHHVFDHEDDVQYLFDEYLRVLMTSRAEGADELLVDFTSGTKPMSAAMFAAAVAADAERITYITGERDQTGRVTVSKGLSEIRPDIIIARRELEKARRLFNEMDYAAASQLAMPYLKSLPAEHELYVLAQGLYKVGCAYLHWEMFKWKQSADELTDACRDKNGLDAVLDIGQLKANRDFCKTLVTSEKNAGFIAPRLVDLARNAERRMRQGRFDDALCRLYRAYEYLVQIRLFEKFRIDTGRVTLCDMDFFELHENTRSKYRFRVNNRPDEPLKLGLREGLELLAELGDEVGQALVKEYWQPGWKAGIRYEEKAAGRLQNWLRVRNNSFLAHGTEPVPHKEVKNLHDMFLTLLSVYFGEDNSRELLAAAEFIKIG